ncbi:PEP/pyruvate-binding domain-containing protein [Tessaracoccus caeni]|uniref:PEP/pyruvate-binding domain-containing protein n=1 Tax=Tessaracoccus caeni TaxID=3031239 RepID=UPI0023DBCB36|nr:PEP/pyruvate-binding domain-containing protein [Tessaracoccus caeni]MDF1488663.1 PEP/pyruvate-binding domain-containing protein [Tessaracoccus caeni]
MTSSHTDEAATNLERFGGKGANLVRLRDAGFPVPPFVVLGTEEYDAFVAEHGLNVEIEHALDDDHAAASRRIRGAFRRPLSEAQRARIAEAVRALGDVAVAVRSSATAEDLPDASFAGQQDTFLDVRGLDAILEAVVECWSSLWTERAISYRESHDVDHAAVSLAVVIQQMVPADASGVMFTADPLTGRRDRIVVDAVLGLGEQLVSGQVVPDHYELDGDGAMTVWHVHGDVSALSLPQLRALGALGRRIAESFGAPQDIEWTRVGDELHVVQSRPITSLYPLPDGPGDGLWFSFGAFQGMLEPITPLGQDALRAIVSAGALLFGGNADFRRNPYLKPAGGRLWVRLDDALRNAVGRRVAPVVLAAADPNGAAVLRDIRDEADYPVRRGSSRGALRRMLPFLRRIAPKIVRALRRPESARRTIDVWADKVVGNFEFRLREIDGLSEPRARCAARVEAVETFAASALPTLLPLFAPVMSVGVLGTLRLRALARSTGLDDADRLALGALRALPGNVTTEMDLALWRATQAIRRDHASVEAFAADPEELAERYLRRELPVPAQTAIEGFMGRYGMRGVAEIDMGVPRWRERPDGVLRTIHSYLTLSAEDAPDVAYERAGREALDDMARLAREVGRVRGMQVRFLGRRVRALFGARETPKFVLVQGLGLLREAFRDTGQDLVELGVLDDADDIFFLHLDELVPAFDGGSRAALVPAVDGGSLAALVPAVDGGSLAALGPAFDGGSFDALGPAFAGGSLAEVVAERRQERARESRRRRVPVALVGDGRALFGGSSAGVADLTGMGVSPGVIEGVARVVDHPESSALEPGEIMVCRGTDPAWTPLFLTASGLVTEVGGLMTHGSVVAREYGLPAVVGIVGATERIPTGSRIRLDGSTGTITLL